MIQHIYYYVDGCGFCERVLPDVLRLFIAHGIQLVVRKPTIIERPAIPGYPALLLPQREGPPVLLVGTGIMDALKEKPQLLSH